VTWLAAAGVLLGVQRLLWPAPAGVIVQGALVGGLTALVSLGIALVYRANRIVNFAQGDLGALPATLAVLLIVSTGVNYFVAMAAGVGTAIVLGAAVEFVVIRRFTNSSRLILTVATIGLAQVLAAGGLLLPQWFHLQVPPQNYPSPFHAGLTIGGTTFHGNDMIAMAVVPVLFVALALVLRRTTIGTVIRASADDPDRASLLGINVHAVRTGVWVIATVLSTLALFLRAGVVGLPIGTVLGPGVLLRALAACVIGRMEDLGVIAGAAIGLGVVEQAVVHHTGQVAYVDPVLFVIILAALLLDRRRRSGRVAVDPAGWLATREVRPVPRNLRHLPEVRVGRWAGLAVVVGVLVALPAVLPESRINLVAAGVIFAIIGLSLVVLTGWGGQVSLGQLAFVGIGAAVAGRVTVSAHGDLTVAVLVAGLVGAGVAVIIGIPALRLGGLELAVTTLAFALATSSYLLNPKFDHHLPTGRIPRHPVLGFVGVASETRYYYLTLVGLGLALLAVYGVRRSRTGRALVAVRENATAARSYGVPSTRVTLTGFAMSGFLAAGAGALFVHHQQSLGASPYAPAESLTAFTMVVVGGLGSVPGALIGAAYVRGIDYFLDAQYRILASGAGLLLVLLVLPDGLGSLLWRVRDIGLGMISRRHGLSPPDEATATPSAGRPEPSPPGERTDAILAVRGIEAGYGHTPVLFGVDLGVAAGEVVALLGTNGAGKSTLLRAVSGLLPPTAGAVTLDGRALTGLPPHRIAALGVAHLPGGHGVFASLTVAENLELARRQARHLGVLDSDTPLAAMFAVLDQRRHDPAGELSGGQQQLLALAMVLLVRPRLLLIDELSLGLAPGALEQLLPLITALRDAGTCILLVEQAVPVALRVADRAYVMEKGRVVFSGSTTELASRPEVLHSIFLSGALGASVPATPRPRPAAVAPVLSVSDVTRRFGGVTALAGIDLELHEGEILGIIGANGAGKTTLFDVICGHIQPDSGTIRLGERQLDGLPPEGRAAAGLGRSFQDSRLFPALTTAETIAVALELHVPVRDPLAAALRLPAVTRSERWVEGRVDELLNLLGLESLADRFVDELSTGTRRIVDLACLLAQQPRVVLFDEPSAGIAQREAEALGPTLCRLRDEAATSLVVIEHDLRLLTSIANRLVALDLGRVIAEGSPADVLHHPAVIASYLGASDAARP
jgi:branched-chain amino acid transport system permease protein